MTKQLSVYPNQGYALVSTKLTGNATDLYPVTKIAAEQPIGIGRVLDINKANMHPHSNLGDTVFYSKNAEVMTLDEFHIVIRFDGIIGQVIYGDGE